MKFLNYVDHDSPVLSNMTATDGLSNFKAVSCSNDSMPECLCNDHTTICLKDGL